MRVLIVDDNATNRRILRGMLGHWDLQTKEVAGGPQALQELLAAKAAGRPYQLVLTDMHMPDMDGFSLVENVRKLPGMSTTAIMMLTSAGHRGDAEKCRELGIASYLIKPIRKWELLSAVMKACGQAESSQQSVVHPEPPQPHSSLRILLAEDNKVNQAVALRTVQKMGHSLAVANNGKEALAMLAEQPFDLVLMDIQMPEMDGITATRAIREAERQTQSHLPIIAMTAHAMKRDRKHCLEAGMDGYVSKPIRARELEKAIIRAARKWTGVTGSESVPSLPGFNVPGLGKKPVSVAITWDISQTLERLGGDEKLLHEVVQIFLDCTPGRLAALQQAVSERNAEALERAAHSLKGELGYLGISVLSQQARELEEMGRNRDILRASTVLAEFGAGIITVLEQMRVMQQEKPSPCVSVQSAGAGQ